MKENEETMKGYYGTKKLFRIIKEKAIYCFSLDDCNIFKPFNPHDKNTARYLSDSQSELKYLALKLSQHPAVEKGLSNLRLNREDLPLEALADLATGSTCEVHAVQQSNHRELLKIGHVLLKTNPESAKSNSEESYIRKRFLEGVIEFDVPLSQVRPSIDMYDNLYMYNGSILPPILLVKNIASLEYAKAIYVDPDLLSSTRNRLDAQDLDEIKVLSLEDLPQISRTSLNCG